MKASGENNQFTIGDFLLELVWMRLCTVRSVLTQVFSPLGLSDEAIGAASPVTLKCAPFDFFQAEHSLGPNFGSYALGLADPPVNVVNENAHFDSIDANDIKESFIKLYRKKPNSAVADFVAMFSMYVVVDDSRVSLTKTLEEILMDEAYFQNLLSAFEVRGDESAKLLLLLLQQITPEHKVLLLTLLSEHADGQRLILKMFKAQGESLTTPGKHHSGLEYLIQSSVSAEVLPILMRFVGLEFLKCVFSKNKAFYPVLQAVIREQHVGWLSEILRMILQKKHFEYFQIITRHLNLFSKSAEQGLKVNPRNLCGAVLTLDELRFLVEFLLRDAGYNAPHRSIVVFVAKKIIDKASDEEKIHLLSELKIVCDDLDHASFGSRIFIFRRKKDKDFLSAAQMMELLDTELKKDPIPQEVEMMDFSSRPPTPRIIT